MKERKRVSCLLILLGMFQIAPLAHSGSIADSLISKIRSQGKSEAVLELPSVMSSVLANPSLRLLSGVARTSMLTTLLKQFTSASQAPFMSVISNLGLSGNTEAFWIANKILIKDVNLDLVQVLSSLPDSFTLRDPHEIKLIQSFRREKIKITKRQEAVEWGVRIIGAPDVWRAKIRGENTIVAGIDTGVFMEHESLIDNYYPGGWFDAVSGRPTPYDGEGHGTHTMGTMVGKYGIGVAPGAKWIACNVFGEGFQDWDYQATRCAQFLLDFKPTPTVVSNSWGSEQGNGFFDQEIEAWQAAGIVPVFSIGNSGPNCTTTQSPGDHPNVIGVGATDSEDRIANFSSRGYAVGSDRRFKPDVSAPGVNVRSASSAETHKYVEHSGTSMAAPHVAGAVALMLSANPNLQFDEIVDKLETRAFRPPLDDRDLHCGAADGNWPNNVYGYGVIDVKNAMDL